MIKKNLKKILGVVLTAMACVLLVACGSSKASTDSSGGGSDSGKSASKDKITIGVSIWSSTDTLGSQCKRMLDAAADAMGVKLMYVDQGHISEQVTASADTLAAAGCDGMIICNSASAEMTSVINTCNDNKMYCAQFFRAIDKKTNPDEYTLAQASPYYVGAVHEDEVANGEKLAQILCKKGCRNIALEGWEAGDATFLQRWKGYKKGIAEWNKSNPSDKAKLLAPQYGGTTSDTGRSTTQAIINANPKTDALIVAGGGGDTLVGSLAAIDSLGLKGKIDVVSTDFLPDLDKQLKSGGMSAESGGHYCDPLYALMMVYNAIKGDYKVSTKDFDEIQFPYLYVSSSEDYASYAKYFVDDLPYTNDEIKKMSSMSFKDLSKSAEALSINDVEKRHGQ